MTCPCIISEAHSNADCVPTVDLEIEAPVISTSMWETCATSLFR
jgi:hypothetical protein